MDKLENDLDSKAPNEDSNDDYYEIIEEVDVDINTLSHAEKRAFARTGVLVTFKQNVYTRFKDETPQFGKINK